MVMKVDDTYPGVLTMVEFEDTPENHVKKIEMYLHGMRLAFRNKIWVNPIPTKSGIVKVASITEYLKMKNKLQVWMFV